MPEVDNSNPRVSVDDAAALARYARLAIGPERLPQLADDLAATLATVEDLAAVSIADVPPVPEPFDPVWPEDPKASRR